MDAAEGSVEEVALAAVPEGTRVLGVDGGKLGEVVAVYRDRLIVERGFFFPTDFYVPFAAVGEYAGGTIRLIVSLREALEFGWEAPPIDESAPIVPAEAPAEPAVPTAPEPALTRVEPATGTAPTPGEPVAPRVPAGPPVVAEPPLPRPAAEGSQVVEALTTTPAAPSSTVTETAERDGATTEESTSVEPAASSEFIEPPAPAADRPKPTSPLVGAAGGSYLSRLFPDLVGQPAGDPLGADPVAPVPTTAPPGVLEPSGTTEPAVDAVAPAAESAAAGPAPAAAAVKDLGDPSSATDVEGDEPKAPAIEREEPGDDPAKE